MCCWARAGLQARDAHARHLSRSVAAAALGFGRRALHEGLHRSRTRRMFGATLADLQLTQAKLAQMATTIDAAALLTYRAAWQRDQGRNVTREAAMAKMTATEGAQQVIDAAVQLWGGAGVASGNLVERLYREIRSLRIYEGATEVQQLIIARELLEGRPMTLPRARRHLRPRPPAAGGSMARVPLRRCPSCGFPERAELRGRAARPRGG